MMGHSLRRALRAMDKESQWTPGDVLLESGSCGVEALPALCAACHTESFSWEVGGLRLGKGTMIECAQHAGVHQRKSSLTLSADTEFLNEYGWEDVSEVENDRR